MSYTSETVAGIVSLLAKYNTANKALAAETDIPAELNMDSTSVLDFIMEVEDHFDVEIPMNVVSETRTIADIATYVDLKRK